MLISVGVIGVFLVMLQFGMNYLFSRLQCIFLKDLFSLMIIQYILTDEGVVYILGQQIC